MKFVAIGRSLTLVNSIRHLIGNGHTLLGVITSTPAPEYADTLEELVRISQDRGVLLLKSTDPLAITSFIERLSDKPDIAVSVNHNAILGMEVLEKFSLGVLNAHGGDLPRYRGNACQAWAIINGEKRIALCIHKMTPGELDSGEIIERDFFEIDSNTYVTECINWIEEVTPILFDRALSKLSADPSYVLEVQKDSNLSPLRCYPRLPIDGKIDWQSTAITIDRLVKASTDPFPGAYSYIGSTRVSIHKCSVVEVEPYCAVPGQIMNFNNETVTVATGQGAVKISAFRIDGRSIGVNDIATSIRMRFTNDPVLG